MEIAHGPDNIQPNGLMRVFNLPKVYLPYHTQSRVVPIKWHWVANLSGQGTTKPKTIHMHTI